MKNALKVIITVVIILGVSALFVGIFGGEYLKNIKIPFIPGADTEQSTQAPESDETLLPSTDSTDVPSSDSTDEPSSDSTDIPAGDSTDTPTGDETDTPTDKEKTYTLSAGTYEYIPSSTYWMGNALNEEIEGCIHTTPMFNDTAGTFYDFMIIEWNYEGDIFIFGSDGVHMEDGTYSYMTTFTDYEVSEDFFTYFNTKFKVCQTIALGKYELTNIVLPTETLTMSLSATVSASGGSLDTISSLTIGPDGISGINSNSATVSLYNSSAGILFEYIEFDTDQLVGEVFAEAFNAVYEPYVAPASYVLSGYYSLNDGVTIGDGMGGGVVSELSEGFSFGGYYNDNMGVSKVTFDAFSGAVFATDSSGQYPVHSELTRVAIMDNTEVTEEQYTWFHKYFTAT